MFGWNTTIRDEISTLPLSSAASRGGGSPRPACHLWPSRRWGAQQTTSQILHLLFSIVMSRFAQTAADIRQKLLGKGALEVGAHKCQKLNNFGNLPTRRFSGLAKPRLRQRDRYYSASRLRRYKLR